MGKIAFVFPGQGAQTLGMGRQLADSLPAAKRLYDQAGDILGYDLARLCFEGPAEELDSTVISQPALFVSSLAALKQLEEHSPEVVRSCEATAGLSLGEYTALVFAGVLSFEDALRVVQQRGQAMQEAADAALGGMVSILGLERPLVERIVAGNRSSGETLEIANLLCPGNIVISGHQEACERAAAAAIEAGAMKAIPLTVAGAFHTNLMASAVDRLAQALQQIKLSAPRITVISNVTARPVDRPEEVRELLVRQVVSPVLWEESMRYLLGQGFHSFYEVGPGRVLRGLLRRIDRQAECESVSC